MKKHVKKGYGTRVRKGDTQCHANHELHARLGLPIQGQRCHALHKEVLDSNWPWIHHPHRHRHRHRALIATGSDKRPKEGKQAARANEQQPLSENGKETKRPRKTNKKRQNKQKRER